MPTTVCFSLPLNVFFPPLPESVIGVISEFCLAFFLRINERFDVNIYIHNLIFFKSFKDCLQYHGYKFKLSPPAVPTVCFSLPMNILLPPPQPVIGVISDHREGPGQRSIFFAGGSIVMALSLAVLPAAGAITRRLFGDSDDDVADDDDDARYLVIVSSPLRRSVCCWASG